MDQEEGLRLIVSPVQLAAILQGASIDQHAMTANRLGGVEELLVGAFELVGAAALFAVPEPTMATKVGGWALAVHGSDTASTGLRQIWSGRQEKTLTAQAATAAADSLGATPSQSELAGEVMDVAVPLFAATLVEAERLLTVRAGRIVFAEERTSLINLQDEENAGGHTIQRHIGRTEAQLRERLAKQSRIPAASSFRSIQEAETAISSALRSNGAQIRAWASGTGVQQNLVLVHSLPDSVGYGVLRSTGQLVEMKNITVVLKKTNIAGKFYFLLTAYPIP